MRQLRLLILGGTSEASALARALAGDARVAPLLSLAGRTKAPVTPPVPFRVGGFGGPAGLAAYLEAERFDLMIDATHPFADRIKRNAVEAAGLAGVPLLAIRRPEWRPQPGDRWTIVPDMAAAAAALGNDPKRVFLTIGQKELAPFREAPVHTYVIRSVDPPDPGHLPPNAVVIIARGPFDEPSERALLDGHRIDVIVTKNSGGTATEAKLAAARALRIPVVMVARPAHPDAETVDTAEQALAWLEARVRQA
ncbi:cobalt-precorrin-6A reductase [Microbaculum marinum]|uniref:Cobalt-precorrin-6A reductase n=1 Tax=Microbaculum marinum TaxID=1764581 RepID=A0AAW9RVI3_9HYPH